MLFTLKKAIEFAIATCIGYLTDKYSLLPDNHFSGLKGRSTVNALITLQEKVYQAWWDKKVISLIMFDVKDAFNGVISDVLVN